MALNGFVLAFLALIVGSSHLFIGTVANTVVNDDGDALTGPDACTYRYGDILNFTCRSRDYYAQFTWSIAYENETGLEVERALKEEDDVGGASFLQLNLTHDIPPAAYIKCFQVQDYGFTKKNITFKLHPIPESKPQVDFSVYHREERFPILKCVAIHRPTDANVTLTLYKSDQILWEETQTGQILWNLHPHEDWNGIYSCVAKNSFGTNAKRLEIIKRIKIGQQCRNHKGCPENSNCTGGKCVCQLGTVAMSFRQEHQCVFLKKLYEQCKHHVQCNSMDRNTFCDWGYCKCTKFHEDTDGICVRRLAINEGTCSSDEECSSAVLNTECNLRRGMGHCECKVGYWQSHGRCVSHRLFANSKFLKVSAVACMMGLILLLVCLTYFTCRSAHLLFLRRKGDQYRQFVLSNQQLSVSKDIPLKSTPDLQIKPSYGPSSPTDREPPGMQRMNSINDDPTICVPEHIPFIKRHDHSVC